MPYDLSGARVLITGSAKRVGRSLALACARSGADVVIHYGGSRGEAEDLQRAIEALGRRADLIQADLNDAAQVERLFPHALAHGPITALVNNASIFEALDWQTTTLESWNRTLMINLTTPFLLSQAFAKSIEPSLPEAQHGRILNLVDWRALRPGADHLPYTISKAALAALTRSLAVALAPRIAVNALALGAILPPVDGGSGVEAVRLVPEARWAKMEELEEAALFLLAGPGYITGEIIHLDGGRHLV